MYITCPKCNTKFSVSSEQIGEDGRKVRCSKCTYVWHQKLVLDVKIEPVITKPKTIAPIGNGVNLPALLPARVTPYKFVMPALMIGLIIFMLTMLFPTSLGISELFNNKYVTIKDVQIINHEEAYKLTVNYKVHNASVKYVKVPLVRIRLLDKNNKILKSFIDDRTNLAISPENSLQIKTEFDPAPASVDHIDIMIGNKVDFILR